MIDYTRGKCPYCGKAFTADDDIAVCPECGTPHHRECYKEHGACANESKHAEGYVWAPEPGAAPPDAGSGSLIPGDTQRCPACGRLNPDDATVCSECGRALGGNGGLTGKPAPSPFLQSPAHSEDELESALWPYSFEDVRADDKIDGYTIREWASYIARSVGYYIYCFKTQDSHKRKMAFTWSAMVFAPIYFLYRKVWWAAVAAMLCNVVLGMPSFVTSMMSGGSFLGISYASWSGAQPVMSMVLLVINILWGIFAAWIYRRNSVRVMDKLRAASHDDGAFHAALDRSGGPSLAAAIAVPFAVALAAALLSRAFGITLPADFSAFSIL